MKLEQMLASLPEPKLSAERRRHIAAEVLAHAELADDNSKPASLGRTVGVAVAVAFAAGIAFVAWPRTARVDVPSLAHVSHVDELSTSTHPLPRNEHRHPMPIAPSDVVIGDEPAPVMPAQPHIDTRIDPSRSQFAGSGDKQRITIEEQLLLESSVAHFKTGWEALRAARFDDAIAAFDRASDPAVAEDATFWAAVAAERAHRADARQRFETFLARFPESPRADSARRALGSLH